MEPNIDGADLHRLVRERLSSVGQRYTTPRRSLVSILGRTGGPVTIVEILRADASLAQSSTYRNITVLEQAGVVHRVVGGDDAVYFELAESLTGHHHHLICAHCGVFIDFTLPPDLEGILDRVVDEVGHTTGFHTEHHRLDLVGTCAGCTDMDPAG